MDRGKKKQTNERKREKKIINSLLRINYDGICYGGSFCLVILIACTFQIDVKVLMMTLAAVMLMMTELDGEEEARGKLRFF